MKDKTKISDIARESNVSISTVSLVLNNKPGVSIETRSRVLEIAQKYEYPVKSGSVISKSTRLGTIGMVVKTDPEMPPTANPFYSKVMMGIEDSCRKNGIDLLFATLPVDENNYPQEIPQLIYNDLVDGLLLVGTCMDGPIQSLPGKRKFPVVLVDGYSTSESYDTVISDNFRASYQAIEYLLEKGHRHIGLIGSEAVCYPSLRDRRNGYLRALKENGINDTYLADFNLNHTKGFQETIDLLNANPQVTALFCINDDVGCMAIRAVQSMGKRVPEDISIIGYDDTYLASNSLPGLTTMHVDTVAMGRAAVDLLSLRLNNPESARMTLTIHPKLTLRESVGVSQSIS